MVKEGLEFHPRYGRYGYLTGKVLSVAHAAPQDDKLGMALPARLRLAGAKLNVDGGVMDMRADMAVSAEIKTGKRWVFDCQMRPLRQHVGKGMTER